MSRQRPRPWTLLAGFCRGDPLDVLPPDPMGDEAADGSLAVPGDATEVATVLLNVAGWGYVQLRHAQHWPADRARDGVMQLVLSGLLPKL